MAWKHILGIVVAVGYLVGNVVLLCLYAGVEVRDHAYTFSGRGGGGREGSVMNVGIAVVVFSVCQMVSTLFILRNLLNVVTGETGVPESTKCNWFLGVITTQGMCLIPAFLVGMVMCDCLFARETAWEQCLAIFSPLHFLPWIAGLGLYLAIVLGVGIGVPWMAWTVLRELCCPQCGVRAGPVAGPGPETVEVVALPVPSAGTRETITVKTPLCEHLAPSDEIVTGDGPSRV